MRKNVEGLCQERRCRVKLGISDRMIRGRWSRTPRWLFVVACIGIILGSTADSPAQLENRTPTGGASIITRKCIGGTNAGVKCKADSECASNECFGFNIVNLTVNMKTATDAGWTPTAVEMTAIRTNFTRS